MKRLFIALVLLQSLAWGAASHVQRIIAITDSSSASATFTASPSANTTAGNFAACVFANEDAAPPTNGVSDNVGNTWTRISTQAAGGGTNSGMSTYWAKLTTALTTSSVMSFTKVAAGNNPSLVSCSEYASWSDTPFDVQATSSGTGTSMATGTTSATTQADEIVITGWTFYNDSAFTLDATYTTTGAKIGLVAGANGDHVLYVGFKILSATGAQTATSTRAAGAGDWATNIATFKAATVVAVPPPSLGILAARNRRRIIAAAAVQPIRHRVIISGR